MKRSTRLHRGGAATSAAVLLLLACAGACRPRGGDPVRATVDDLVAAARDRDAGAVEDLLAPDFQAADGSPRAEVGGMLRRYFAAYEKLDVDVRNLEIERSEGAALVRFQADLSGKGAKVAGIEGLIPSTSSWKIEARLVPVDGKWRVAWANWAQADSR